MLKKIYTFGYVLLFSLFFLGKAIADPLIIEDFDDISGWSNGLTLETSNIKAGTGAALWGDTETYQYLNRSFNAPIDLTAYNQFTFWVHSDAANNALIEIIFTSSGGYFRHQMQVDWLGWRAVSVHKKDFKISKPTASWASIDKFGFNSSGWGHEPTPGTRLIFDDVRFTLSPVTNIQKQVQYVNGDYVFNFSVLVNNPSLLSRTFNIVPGEQNDTSINITATNSIVTLLPDESGSFNISVTIPQNIIDPAKALDLLRAEFQLYEGDVLLEGIRLPSHMPLAERSFPRTFLNAADFERMNLWAADATLPWATKAKNDIISQADGWRAKFNTKYGVDWYVPSGGAMGRLVCVTRHSLYTYISSSYTNTY